MYQQSPNNKLIFYVKLHSIFLIIIKILFLNHKSPKWCSGKCIHFHSCFSWDEISHEGLWHGSLNSFEPHCSVQDNLYSIWHLPITSFDSYCFLLRFLCRNWACFSCVISWLDCHNQLATIIIQLRRIGTENTRDINNPLLSKYCCLENNLQCVEATSLIFSEK